MKRMFQVMPDVGLAGVVDVGVVIMEVVENHVEMVAITVKSIDLCLLG